MSESSALNYDPHHNERSQHSRFRAEEIHFCDQRAKWLANTLQSTSGRILFGLISRRREILDLVPSFSKVALLRPRNFVKHKYDEKMFIEFLSDYLPGETVEKLFPNGLRVVFMNVPIHRPLFDETPESQLPTVRRLAIMQHNRPLRVRR